MSDEIEGEVIEFSTVGVKTMACRVCGIEKDVRDFRVRNKRTGSRRTECKACLAEYKRNHYMANRDRYQENNRRWAQENSQRAAEIKAAWFQRNKERLRIKSRENYHANLEVSRANGRRKQRRYLHRNRAKRNARRRELYALNPAPHRARASRWARENPEKRRVFEVRRRASLAAWRRENRHKVNAWTRNRRAKIKRAEGWHSPEDIERLLKWHKGRCYWCRKPHGDDYHVDHVTPISKGGPNHVGNLCISCATCNTKKGAKAPSEFAGVLL